MHEEALDVKINPSLRVAIHEQSNALKAIDDLSSFNFQVLVTK